MDCKHNVSLWQTIVCARKKKFIANINVFGDVNIGFSIVIFLAYNMNKKRIRFSIKLRLYYFILIRYLFSFLGILVSREIGSIQYIKFLFYIFLSITKKCTSLHRAEKKIYFI